MWHKPFIKLPEKYTDVLICFIAEENEYLQMAVAFIDSEDIWNTSVFNQLLPETITILAWKELPEFVLKLSNKEE